MKRGQIWTLLRGGSQHRGLVISNDEYDGVEELAVWALTVVRDVPHPNHLAVRLGRDDPLSGAFVRIHSVVQILDRSALPALLPAGWAARTRTATALRTE